MRIIPACIVLILFATFARGQALDLKDRWLYYPTNLLVDKNVDELETIWARAAKAGYNGVLLSDSKFCRLADLDPRYFRNVERVKQIARTNHLEIIPAVFPVGYSDDILSQDPNLAEGLPVRDALFVVHNGEARLVADPPVALRGGDMSDLKKWDWHDPCVTTDGDAAKMTDPKGQNARLSQKVTLHPWRQYHIWVRVKTRDFQGTPEVKVLAADKTEGPTSLVYSDLGVKRTQDWTTHHVVFNSLGHSQVNVYLGAWGATTGSVWWADAKLEEVGLVNLIRRDGAPLAVTRELPGDRSELRIQPLVEGQDFQKVVDPKMGCVPWKGAYDIYHEPPALKTALPDGTRLRVSYYHTVTVGDGQVMICPSELKTVDILRDHAKRVHALFAAKAYFMSHDEIRVLGWDESCLKRKLTPGQILADNVQTCTKILKQINPGGRIYVWSDMFDPNHNAHKDYYLVNGDLANSWDGLDKDVIIGVWYLGKARESMKFFADRGNPMLIAGYYDDQPEQIAKWLAAARDAGQGKVQGVMYTTWQHRYGDLEAFAKQLPHGP